MPESTFPYSGPHVFVDNIFEPELLVEDVHHLKRVRRVKPNEQFTISDGNGHWRFARFDQDVRPLSDVFFSPRELPLIRIGLPLLKSDKTHWALQKIVEIGIDVVFPLFTQRGIVVWDTKKEQDQLTRWNKIIREAAMQSRRCWLPTIEHGMNVEQAVLTYGATLSVPSGDLPKKGIETLLVGPEGGWSNEELALGDLQVRLGNTILRAETAVIVGATILTSLRNCLVQPSEL